MMKIDSLSSQEQVVFTFDNGENLSTEKVEKKKEERAYLIVLCFMTPTFSYKIVWKRLWF